MDWILQLGACFLFILGVTGLWLGYRRRRETKAILAGGVPATATVTQVYRVWHGRSSYDYYIVYQFEVMGQTYDKKESVSYSYYREHGRGSQVEIRYLPENPAGMACIASEAVGEANLRMFVSAFALVMAVFLVIVAPILQPQSQNRNQPVQVTLTPWWPNADLAAIRAVIEPQIPAWREAASADTATHHITAAQAGLAPSLNLSSVDYGYCQNHGFYVIVLRAWQKKYNQGFPYRAEAYSYIVDSHRLTAGFPIMEVCAPDADFLFLNSDAGGGWYFSNVLTDEPPTPHTTLPPPTPTPAP